MAKKTTAYRVPQGSTYKRCHCTDPSTLKELGADCPKLYRGNGYNSQHGLWRYQIELPATTEGKRRPLRRGSYASQTEAEGILGQIRDALAVADPGDRPAVTKIGDMIEHAIDTCGYPPTAAEIRYRLRLDHDVASIPLTGDFLDQWLKGRKKIKNGTRRSYEAHIRLHLTPVIGMVRLDQLRKSHIREIFSAIEERNELINECRASRDQAKRDKVKGLRVIGANTMQRIRATLRKALFDAMGDGYLLDNPARRIELPSVKKQKPIVWTDERVAEWSRIGQIPSAVMVWTPEQTGRFLDHAEAAADRLYALYHLVVFTGLRRGEAVGLHWSDLDLNKGTAMIRWQIVQVGWATEMDDPKTDDSQEPVALDLTTVQALRAHRIRQWRDRAAAGDRWTETGLVFTTPIGEQLHPANVTDHFKFLSRQAGLPPIRLHDLRHGTAALGRAAGLETKIISGRLRHSSTTITDDLYGSILPESARDAAERTAAMVPRQAKAISAS